MRQAGTVGIKLVFVCVVVSSVHEDLVVMVISTLYINKIENGNGEYTRLWQILKNIVFPTIHNCSVCQVTWTLANCNCV